MKPTDFKQSTKVLQRPSTMAESECEPLPVWTNGKECISCWKPSIIERMRIAFGGNIFLGVITGKATQPPVFVSGSAIFDKTPLLDNIKYFIAEIKDFFSIIRYKFVDTMKQTDKRQHVLAGFIISLIVGILTSLMMSEDAKGWWIGLMVGSFAGIIKEFRDSYGHGSVEVMDALCTTVGAACGIPGVFLFCNLIF